MSTAIRPIYHMRVVDIRNPKRKGTVVCNPREGDHFYTVSGGQILVRWDGEYENSLEVWLVDCKPEEQ